MEEATRKKKCQRTDVNHRKPFRLQPRDAQIIKAVNDCQGLTVTQVTTAFFGTYSSVVDRGDGTPKNTQAYERMRGLLDYYYLKATEVPLIGFGTNSSHCLFTLDRLGAEVLVENFGYTSDDLRYPSKKFWQAPALPHLMFLNDFRMAVIRAVHQDKDYELVDWVDEIVFRRKPDFVSTGKGKPKPVYPDWYFSLQTPLGMARFFVEADRGTEQQSQVRSQFEIYHHYVMSGKYQQTFRAKSLMILVVTTSNKRLHELKKSIVRAGSADLYWLTTKDQFTQAVVMQQPLAVFEAPIWERAGSTEPSVLISR